MVVLPSSGGMIFLDLMLVLILIVGEIHRVDFINYSRSPLSEPDEFNLVVGYLFKMSGRLHRGDSILTTLVLPSLNRILYLFAVGLHFVSGRFTG